MTGARVGDVAGGVPCLLSLGPGSVSLCEHLIQEKWRGDLSPNASRAYTARHAATLSTERKGEHARG